MRQSRLMSLVEAMVNVVVGYVLAVGVRVLVFPLFGLHAKPGQTWRSARVHPRLARAGLRAATGSSKAAAEPTIDDAFVGHPPARAIAYQARPRERSGQLSVGPVAVPPALWR